MASMQVEYLEEEQATAKSCNTKAIDILWTTNPLREESLEQTTQSTQTRMASSRQVGRLTKEKSKRELFVLES